MKRLYIILIAIAFIAVTVFVYQRNENNENAEMERFAKIIANERDEEFEKATEQIIDKIENDTLFHKMLDSDIVPIDDSITVYLNSNYFNKIELYKNYNRTFTLCDNSTLIRFNDNDSLQSCDEYFANIFESYNSYFFDNGLCHIDDPTSDIYYIVMMMFDNYQTLYLEFYKEKIYNKLLLDSDSTNFDNFIIPNLKNYSFAIYNNNILHYKLGNYYYPNSFKNFISQEDGLHRGKEFKHFILNDLDNYKSIIVSIESERWMKFVAPISIIFFTLLLAYFFYIYFEKSRSNIFKRSFHIKMQFTVLLVLTFSFFAIGITSFLFLRNNITKKTQIEQYKQANIIRNNLESNLLTENNVSNYDIIHHLKETFFCDISIYDLDGILINSTLPGANIDEDILNENAYKTILFDNAGYYLQKESYKDEKYSSYYFPILDKNNKLIAILNVIYFDFQQEYNDNLSDFALNYLNIIIVLLVISSIIVILITRKTLKPLKIIENQMSKISLEGINEPINFKGRDEIGALVKQYNNMCRQLEIAANKLARNERESAWREMARQVAHEIKNPLTPMRLNIEYLQILWDRKDAKFEENFKETLKSLLEQIDTLSKIATAFSDYAKLPENTPTSFDLAELLKSTIKLYDVEKNITISLSYNEKDAWTLYADKNNLSRVFGNIIKNAIQAIGSEQGLIKVILSNLEEKYQIKISDNGCGIKDDDKNKVFFPNFTTKSSGMGVGLSVSQDIVQRMGGSITFESEVGKGTVFIIDIPILKEI
ncbi:MAG: HAMP domain-containing histidine kinase [Bacteroidales bacterium]|nr:HAMP domain-containing histidine kinase [Bacteroidales bacterium]